MRDTLLLPPGDDDNDPQVLPAENLPALQPYIEVTVDTDDKNTTIADLNLLHNALIQCDAALAKPISVDSLCKLALTVNKCIETRRKVKKLAFGQVRDGGARTFEFLE